jgi:hypothetical protein
MSVEISDSVFRELYESWVRAISQKDYAWFEKHLSDDFAATAHVWPKLRLDKEAFIELDKQIIEISAEWQEVHAVPLGDLVVTVANLRMHREVFAKEAAVAGADAESGDDLASLASGGVVTGKLCSYTGVWKLVDGVWKIIDHRMVDATE